MQSMHRQIGKFKKRSADDNQVSVLLNDFEEADKLLGRIVEAVGAWRDAWSAILACQTRMIGEFEGLYVPIVGSSDSSTAHQAAVTPPETLARTQALYQEYDELQKELLVDLNAVDDRMIKPALSARDCLNSLRKTIKKRGDRKLDYEHYQSRFDSASKKPKKTDKDTVALAKVESELAQATEEYHAADEHLRQRLPPLVNAAFSMLPRLLAVQIDLQNNLSANYYTVVYNYCEQHRFQSPSPPMEQIVQEWEHDFLSTQEQVESLGCIANGKAVKQFALPEDQRNNSRFPSISNGVNSFRRTSGQNAPEKPPRPVSPGRTVSSPVLAPKPNLSSKPSFSAESKPRFNEPIYTSSNNLTVPSASHGPPQSVASSPTESYASAPEHNRPGSAVSSIASSVASRADYFTRQHNSNSNAGTSSVVSTPASLTSPNISAIAGKKKPPPPPKPKRPSLNVQYVTALYDFGGQGPGDLAFVEGDQIRVLKKTESTDDWWEGELRGVQGSFPANYVK